MSGGTFAEWHPRLRSLCDRIRAAAREALLDAVAQGDLSQLMRPVAQGAGDVAFGIDVPTEDVLSAWLEETAQAGPLSLLTEDTGWRHRGPNGALDGFDHGGPRIAVDPIDGTRGLMADLRSAWTVVGFAPPGEGQPVLSELSGGLVAELPTSRESVYRVLAAERGRGCTLERSPLQGPTSDPAPLRVDDDDRVDGGYFPFFRYSPPLRPLVAKLEAAFFARLAEQEGADTRHCFDDQYLSSAGQLVLLALGSYRFVADLRGTLCDRHGLELTTSKPYDVSGAVLCALEAGCVLRDGGGGVLDSPIDTESPVSFVGYHNRATHRRLEPHLSAVLEAGS